jgi:hypothetical protein
MNEIMTSGVAIRKRFFFKDPAPYQVQNQRRFSKARAQSSNRNREKRTLSHLASFHLVEAHAIAKPEVNRPGHNLAETGQLRRWLLRCIGLLTRRCCLRKRPYLPF